MKPDNWEAVLTPAFKKGYRNLSSEIQKRVDEAIEQLMGSDDPTVLGVRKIGQWKGAYTYEIGRRYRIFYIVLFQQRTIEFLDVGGHELY